MAMSGRSLARELLGLLPENGGNEECYRPLSVHTARVSEWRDWAEEPPFMVCPISKDRYRGWFVGLGRWRDEVGPPRTVRESQPYLWTPEVFEKDAAAAIHQQLLSWNPFGVRTIQRPDGFVDLSYPRPMLLSYLARVEGGEFDGLTIGLFLTGITHGRWDYNPDLNEEWAWHAVDYLVDQRPQGATR